MTESIHKQIVDKLAELMEGITPAPVVATNEPLPEEVPDAGLIIVRDGKPEPSEETLGGFDTVYMTCVFPIEVYVTGGTAEIRDEKYDALLQAVATQLQPRDENDQRSLGGLVFGLILNRPEPMTEPIEGALAVKAATVKVHIEYAAPSALG